MGMNFYLDLFNLLDQAEVDYVLVGGIAVNLHGAIRMTADADLIVHLEKTNVHKFAELMTAQGYKPRAPVSPFQLADENARKDWIEHKEMKVFSFFHNTDHFKIVDVFVTEPIPFKDLLRESVVRDIEGIRVRYASIDHMLLLKKQAGREQDLEDIRALEYIKRKKTHESQN